MKRALRSLCAGLLLATLPWQVTVAEQRLPAVPEAETLAALIRWTMLAVSQANLTGNYTVLRELGSPDFQNANSSAKLAMAFAGPREQGLDLTFAVSALPQLSAAPTVDAQGVLRIVGYYPTRPLQVNFDLSFQAVDGTWRHSQIALAAGPPLLRMPSNQPLAGVTQQVPPVKKQTAKN